MTDTAMQRHQGDKQILNGSTHTYTHTGAVKWAIPPQPIEDKAVAPQPIPPLPPQATTPVDALSCEGSAEGGTGWLLQGTDGAAEGARGGGGTLARAASSASSRWSVGSSSALRTRMWEEVVCGRCEASLGQALVFSSQAQAQAPQMQREREQEGEREREQEWERTHATGTGESADASTRGGGERWGQPQAKAVSPLPMPGGGGADGGSGVLGGGSGLASKGRGFKSRRQHALSPVDVQDDRWGVWGKGDEAAEGDWGKGGDGEEGERGGLPASAEGLTGRQTVGGHLAYAREGGVMVVLDDGRCVWCVVCVCVSGCLCLLVSKCV